MTIYTRPNTRTVASQWIFQNIPAGAFLATEHWDDKLPVGNQVVYQSLELPLYDPDTPYKWAKVAQTLQQTDYIILASNRLYTPLQKLTGCDSLPPGKCYRQTAAYYQYLFNNQLGFTKVAEFTSYPTIPFTDIIIDDQSADESFTVYDHPKVTIYGKLPK